MFAVRLPSSIHQAAQYWEAGRSAGILLGAWTAGMISMPILLWFIGPAALPWAASFTVLLQLACVLAVLSSKWMPRSVARTSSVILLGAWVIEFFGSRSGWLFGNYDYTNLFRPQIVGVPVLIPLAWLMMLPTSWAVAQVLTRRSSGPAFLIISALAFTAWDLFLDPQMVAWGAWIWPHGGGYFGIPWHNFAGWMLSAALLTALARPVPVPARPLLVIYTVTWVLQTIGLGVFWHAPGPALWGFLVMGFFVIRCWQVIRHDDSASFMLAP